MKQIDDWDVITYNTSTHSTTRFTSAELMFGRKFKVSMDIIYGSFEIN